ncbi:MAG TPA: DJ-1/PfpI family protein, partial [Opitutaceae bacterium]|nr:DJ-1/PfpI family protein [Opitutaceae bacterium]
MGYKSNLNGKRIAILVADGFEQIELTSPQEALKKSGAETVIVSPKQGSVQGYHHEEPGDKIKVDLSLNDARGSRSMGCFSREES